MQITTSSYASLNDILTATPPGLTAMFRVTSISSDVEDWLCGEHVYVKGGQVFDFMSDTPQATLNEVSLHFISYIRN